MNMQVTFADQSQANSPFPWRFIATFSVLLMELSIVVSWLELVATPLRPRSFWILMIWFSLFALAANGLHRLSEQVDVPRTLVIVLSAGLLILGLFVSLNLVEAGRTLFDMSGAFASGIQALMNVIPPAPELLVMVLVIYIWRRGAVSATSTYLEQGRTGFKFRLGVLIFILYSLIRGRVVIPPALPLFFFSSLLAMSLTRANHITKLSAGGDPPFSVSWLLSLGALFLMTMAAGLGVGRLLSSAILYRALEGIRQLILRTVFFMYQLSLPLLLALDAMLQRWLENLSQESQSSDIGPLEEFLGAAGEWAGREPPLFIQRMNEFFADLAVYWPTARIVIVGSVLILIVISSIRLVLKGSIGDSNQGVATTEGEGLPLINNGRLRQRVRQLGQELRSWGQALMAGQLSTAIVVRRLYGKLLELAEDHGRSRYQWETPLEFKNALTELFPTVIPEIEMLTDAYVQVRYGELPETTDLVLKVRAAWERVQQTYRA